ncbi:HAD-IB family hydrolase [Glycomyces sp. TRM65418]|uniref:HAD family hydrolase n=1 Tax=Glycomyces sp. TRM65418 TaxID=2867006 RepID=UPI001CE6D9E4|nr:HAD-IB family hydrolase [Glycomyces sp. TRM65418]MCC3764040.1 HAD-IB family hydrolase [Glycomyces sp. TRM65418]QZD53731.1 HAD-IB family hydrolase [Glycomyces sp. TRM65418]
MNAAEPISGSSALSLEPDAPVRAIGAQARPGAAFFDLDKTVIAKASSLAFSRPLYQGGLLARRDVLKVAYSHLLFRLGGSGDEVQMARTRDQIAQLSRGWPAEEVRSIVNETLEELIAPSVYAEAAALIEAHRSAGRAVVLVSASGEEMVAPIGRMLGATDVIASRMKIGDDGRYTGEIAFYAAGPAKAEALKEFAVERGVDLDVSFAYSDSITDEPMLRAVGYPRAVNPDRGLRRLAQEEGWPQLAFRRPVALRQPLPRPNPLAVAATGVGVAAVAYVVWRVWRERRLRTA